MLRRKRRPIEGRRYPYGQEFQLELVRCCLARDFLRRNRPMLDAAFLAYAALRLVTATILRIYDRTGDVPSLATVKQELHEQGELGPDVTEVLGQIRRIAVTRADQLEVETRISRFVEHARLEVDLNEALGLLRSGEIDEAKAIVQRTMIGHGSGQAYNYLDEVEKRALSYTNGSSVRRPAPTGFQSIDEELAGGVGAGELAFAIGATGTGKSILLVNIGYAALAAGLVVAHYTLELTEQMLSRRYDMRITGMTKRELKAAHGELGDRIGRAVDWQKAKLLIKQFPMRTLTPTGLRASVLSLPRKPDVVIVDYADVMRPPRKREKDYLEAREIYEGLKAVAQELQVPVWTASQGNREAYARRRAKTTLGQTISIENIADAYAKAAPADVVISINQAADDRDKCWIYVAKVREARSGFDVWIEPLYHRMILREKESTDDEEKAEEEDRPPF